MSFQFFFIAEKFSALISEIIRVKQKKQGEKTYNIVFYNIKENNLMQSNKK